MEKKDWTLQIKHFPVPLHTRMIKRAAGKGELREEYIRAVENYLSTGKKAV